MLLVLELALLVLAADVHARGHVRDAHGGVGGVDALPARAAGAEDLDAQVAGVDVDLDVLGLGQHDHGGGGGVDAAGGLGDGHALHAVHAALVLEHGEGALALDLERDLLVAAVVVLVGGEDLDLEPLGLGVARVHARELAGEDAGLVAAGAGADLDDHVLAVVGVAREHAHADLLAELVDARRPVDELLLGEARASRRRRSRRRAGLRRRRPSAPPRGSCCVSSWTCCSSAWARAASV